MLASVVGASLDPCGSLDPCVCVCTCVRACVCMCVHVLCADSKSLSYSGAIVSLTGNINELLNFDMKHIHKHNTP